MEHPEGSRRPSVGPRRACRGVIAILITIMVLELHIRPVRVWAGRGGRALGCPGAARCGAVVGGDEMIVRR